MKELLDQMDAAAVEEYKRSMDKFPLFASGHEAYGVIKEEIEEAHEDASSIDLHFLRYWKAVRSNDIAQQKQALMKINELAEHMAAESTQVAAMSYKAIKGMVENENHK